MMSTAIERDVLAELSTAVAAYLTTMAATADCLEQSWPEIGAPYRKRIHGLQSRLSFDVTREAIKDSAETLAEELKDYACVVSRLQNERSVDLERGILALADMIDALTKQQGSYRECLRDLAAQVERAPYPADARAYSEMVAQQTAGLRNLAEAMSAEATSLHTQMSSQTAALEELLAGPASIDPLSGLINHVEFQRQVAAHKMHGAVFSILLFRLHGPVGDQVIQQAATRLSTTFRRRDRVARWSKDEFAVLFAGPSQPAGTRAAHAAAGIAGPYMLLNGEVVHITSEVRVLPQDAQL